MSHPFPSYHRVLDRSAIPGDSLPDLPMVNPDEYAPDTEETAIDERREWKAAPPPQLPRTPAVLHYPKARDIIFVSAGVDIIDRALGFDCRAIVIQNVSSLNFLYADDIGMYLTTSSTPMATFNLPGAMQNLTLHWHSALFNAASPAAVAGQFAIVWLFDDWIMPATAASGGGGGSTVVTSATATATQVAFNIADQIALAANANRKGASFYNHAATDAYLQYGAAATTANFKVRIRAEEYFEMAPEAIYTGAIHVIFDAGGSGNMNIVELA